MMQGSRRWILGWILTVGVVLPPIVEATTPIITNFGGATQVWIRGDDYNAKQGNVATANEAQAITGVPPVPGSFSGSPMVFYVSTDRLDEWVEYRFSLPQDGLWHVWGRAAGPADISQGSHFLWALGHPTDGNEIPTSLPTFVDTDDRFLGDEFGRNVPLNKYEWVGEKIDIQEPNDPRFGRPKQFLVRVNGQNMMRIYNREADPRSVQWDIICITNVDRSLYWPNDTDAAKAFGIILSTRAMTFPTAVGVIVPGQPIVVTISNENPSTQTKSLSISETYPAGWTVSQISSGGTNTNGVITWTYNATPGVSTVSYTLTPPASVAEGASWSGTSQTDNGALLQIGGAQSAEVATTLNLGMFEGQIDIGNTGGYVGNSELDEGFGEYLVRGSGAGIGGTGENGYFLFREVSGPFTFKGFVFLNSNDNGGAESGLMIRNNLTPGSSMATGILNADFTVQGKYRGLQDTVLVGGDQLPAEGHIELSRVGKRIDVVYIAETGERVLYNTYELEDLVDPVYVGLFTHSGTSSGAFAEGAISEVELNPLAYTADRILPTLTMVPGQTIQGVQVVVDVVPGQTANITVTETSPPGWTVSNIQRSAGTHQVNANGQIVWTLANATGRNTMTYDVTPPQNTLAGLFDGVAASPQINVLLGKDSVLANIPLQFKYGMNDTPVPVPLVDGDAFIEAEDGQLIQESQGTAAPYSIRIRPELRNQQYANADTRNVPGNELRFHFAVTTAGTYRVLVNTMTPDDGKNSWYIGMDDNFGNTEADNATNRFQGSGILDKNFHVSWLTVDGNQDLTFDLTPGNHVLRFQTREADCGLDWVYITNDINLEPSEFTPPPYEAPPYTSVTEYMLY